MVPPENGEEERGGMTKHEAIIIINKNPDPGRAPISTPDERFSRHLHILARRPLNILRRILSLPLTSGSAINSCNFPGLLNSPIAPPGPDIRSWKAFITFGFCGRNGKALGRCS